MENCVMKNRVIKLESMSKAYIKSLSLEEIEDILRDNVSPEELKEMGISPKIAELSSEAVE